MNKKIYIANWKSHKTLDEAEKFFENFQSNVKNIDFTNKEVVIAPPYPLLEKSRRFIDDNSLDIKLAAQNVSSFPEGAYTGEVSARQIKEFVEYVIVGHSERKRYFHESESDIENKIREAREIGLEVVLCVQDEKNVINDGVKLVAYEPPSAIGSGNPDDPEHIAFVFKALIEQKPDIHVLYGGSVSSENIHQFKEIVNLSGFLIGGASLDPESFVKLLNG